MENLSNKISINSFFIKKDFDKIIPCYDRFYSDQTSDDFHIFFLNYVTNHKIQLIY